MRFRERRKDDQQEQASPAPTSGGPAAGGLSQLRQAGEDLLKAADEAINRALSGDSEAFVAANRQCGGQ